MDGVISYKKQIYFGHCNKDDNVFQPLFKMITKFLTIDIELLGFA